LHCCKTLEKMTKKTFKDFFVGNCRINDKNNVRELLP
jgi:hypothetical protein